VSFISYEADNILLNSGGKELIMGIDEPFGIQE